MHSLLQAQISAMARKVDTLEREALKANVYVKRKKFDEELYLEDLQNMQTNLDNARTGYLLNDFIPCKQNPFFGPPNASFQIPNEYSHMNPRLSSASNFPPC